MGEHPDSVRVQKWFWKLCRELAGLVAPTVLSAVKAGALVCG